MTQVMPLKIKRNFIYRQVWRDIYRQKQNCTFLFIGKPGTGKSTAAIRFGQDLDSGFNSDRIVFSVEDFIGLMRNGDSKGKLKRGSVILFDEIAGSEKAASARNAMTKENKRMNFTVTTYRAKGFIVFMCAPMISQIDSVVRKVGITGIAKFESIDFRSKRSFAQFYWSTVSAMSGKQYMPKPRVRDVKGEVSRIDKISIPLPRKELVDAYEKKKADYIDVNLARWHEQLLREKGKAIEKIDFKPLLEEAVRQIKDLTGIDKRGKPYADVGLIRAHFSCGEVVSRNLQRALNALISTGRLKV